MAENNYLMEWEDQFSLPNYLTGNSFLSPDGSTVSGDEASLNLAQNILLNGSAVGTHDKHFLNPTPLFNKLGEIYTTIVNSAFKSARTDAIKMNRYNMDYTNGESTLKAENLPIHEFFRFFEDTNDLEINSEANAQRLASILATMERKNPIMREDGVKEFSITALDDYYYNMIQYWGNTWFNHNSEIWPFMIENGFADSEDTPQKMYTIYRIVFGDGLESEEYCVPTVRMSSLLRRYLAQYGTGAAGLQLLMPQYKRRVEVEDLNENFWVISQILDAVVNALWGPYGLIDVIRQLILKITQIEEYLGLDQVEDIDIMMAGDDDMYFDMYSRFELSSLQLKLKTPTGERVLKDIFKNHNERSDRKNTTDKGNTVHNLFDAIQKEIIHGNNSNDQQDYKGLYDSDIIRSQTPVSIGGKKEYLSLSTVIDALNDRIVEGVPNFNYYNYSNDTSIIGTILKKLDPTKDGTMTIKDIETRKKDIILEGTLLSAEQIKALGLQKESKDTIYAEIIEDLDSNSLKDFYKKYTGEEYIGQNIEEEFIKTISVRSYDEKVDEELNVGSDLANTILREKLTSIGTYLRKLAEKTIGVPETDLEALDAVKAEISFNILNYDALVHFSDKIKVQEAAEDTTISLNDKNTIKVKLLTDDEEQSARVVCTEYKQTQFTVRAIAYAARVLALPSESLEKLEQMKLLKLIFDINGDDDFSSRDCARYAALMANGLQDYYSLKAAEAWYEETKKSGSVLPTESVRSVTYYLADFLKNSDLFSKKITVPTNLFFEYLLSFFAKVENPGITEVTIDNETDIEKSIETVEYGLYDNILIFLYDSNYYNYEHTETQKEDNTSVVTKLGGLYVKTIDSFYEGGKPLIRQSNKDKVYTLFVPRKDLYGGEIIQLRLTEKNQEKKYYVDFSTLDVDNGFSIQEETNSKLFLSLHNCFSTNPTYNNTRTTLFFKDTTPEKIDIDNIKSISEWFNNGIQCYYFKPYIKSNNQTKTFIPKTKSFDLKIYASMIAKRDDYIDNSFTMEEYTITPTEPLSANPIQGIYETNDGQTYVFKKEQKYCAAIRNNLIFYSTAGLNENNQYIHSPLQMLMSARKRGDSESIQTTRVEGQATSVGVGYPTGRGMGTLQLNDIKDILYKNAYSRIIPMTIQAFFGSRKVNEYVKWKKLKYIVFEKENGTRNEDYGPTHATITAYDGYMHWSDGIKVINNAKQYFCPIKWVYQKESGELDITTSDDNRGYPPAKAKYGYIELDDDFNVYANNFSIQVFSCNLKNNNQNIKEKETHQFETETTDNENVFRRRPIFKMVYFFGENEIGTGGIGKHAPYNEENQE